jgi:cytidyltransferase-like protein
MKIAVISGGFDPIHSGHISYLQAAATKGKKLVVCLNSDEWLIQKKGKFFLPFEERISIIKNLKLVDEVIAFDDDERGSCINGLLKIQKQYPDDEIIFCNGGDRDGANIPEMELDNIHFEFSVGGRDKKNSSSWILKNWTLETEERIWGRFSNLHQDDNVKVKELIVLPGKGMSFQKHFHRDEIWLVSKGKCRVNFSEDDPDNFDQISLGIHDHFMVRRTNWHQITNPFDVPCHIIEIQYGSKTEEEDIERLYYFEDQKNN